MKLTESVLRKMIKEESKKLKIQRGKRRVNENASSFYAIKLDYLYSIKQVVEDAVHHERTSAIGEDPELLEILRLTEDLIDATLAVADMW
jgi:hypothetical protein